MAGNLNHVSERVRALYDDIGWKESDGGVTYDAETSEDLRPCARAYLSATRRRVARHLPASGDRLLDMASGPIQYREYLEYSADFQTRVCVDLSQRALDGAKAKLGDRGEYWCGDFFDLDIPPNSVDVAISLHTIYHIHTSRQAEIVRKLLSIVRPGCKVIVVYSNPDNVVSLLMKPIHMLRSRRPNLDSFTPENIYFNPLPLEWWRQFKNSADVKIYPWRTFSTPAQKVLIPSGRLGEWLFQILFRLEDLLPWMFVRFGCYPMIVLEKR